MIGASPAQQSALDEIAQSLQETNSGRNWPEEYKSFSLARGYFNSIYNVLYTDPVEWRRIALFSIDPRFIPLWRTLRRGQAVRELAKLPCVGDGRDGFRPSINIQIAFHTCCSVFFHAACCSGVAAWRWRGRGTCKVNPSRRSSAQPNWWYTCLRPVVCAIQ
jgi:hypothetical protein